MEDVSTAQAVPVGIYDNGQVPDQFESKDSPLLRVPMFTQQGERTEGNIATAQMQRELTQLQDQINVMQQQLQRQQTQVPISPQLPGSPMYPHVVPREYGRLQNQQVPLSPQHPQINFGGGAGGSGGGGVGIGVGGSSALHRNVVNNQMRQQQYLAPPPYQQQYHQQYQQQQQQIQQQQQQLQQQQQQLQQQRQQLHQLLLQQQQQQLQQQNQFTQQNQQMQQLHQHFNQQQQMHQQRLHQQPQHTSFGEQVVRKDAMMSYLMDSLNVGQHIGHYGCLVFAIVAHHFMTETAVINYLMKDPSMTHAQAKELYDQVQTRDYNPPRRDKILEWQAHQTFPIIPNPSNQDFGNVYKDLRFPDHVYEHIAAYYSH